MWKERKAVMIIQKTQVKIQAVTMKNCSEGFISAEARAAKKT